MPHFVLCLRLGAANANNAMMAAGAGVGARHLTAHRTTDRKFSRLLGNWGSSDKFQFDFLLYGVLSQMKPNVLWEPWRLVVVAKWICSNAGALDHPMKANAHSMQNSMTGNAQAQAKAQLPGRRFRTQRTGCVRTVVDRPAYKRNNFVFLRIRDWL
jgi:hypothetical protein